MSGGAGSGPAFRGFVKASGQAAVWEGGKGEKEGGRGLSWQSRTNESAYSSDTLIGNWNEERFDISCISQPKCLPSQHNHYFESTYQQAYCRSPPRVPEILKYSRGGEPKAFPAHQPVLDPPEYCRHYSGFMTSSMEAYGVPEHRQRNSASTPAIKDPPTHS